MPSRSSADRAEGKSLWVRVDLEDSWESRKRLVEAASDLDVDMLVVKEEDIPGVMEMGWERVAVVSPESEKLPEGVTVVDDNPSEEGSPDRAAMLTIATGKDQDLALSLADVYSQLIVHCEDWQVIPLENLIAACQTKGSTLLAAVSGPDEAKLALEALQKGADGVVLAPKGPDDLAPTAAIVRSEQHRLELTEVEVLSVEPAGSGDRACVDTCSILEKGEGLLIGSQADGLALVHAENLETDYVESRPFRVNAGAIHSYVLDTDNKTRYLSDLRAGDSVMTVKADGFTRTVTVGRVKIETRPLSMLEMTHEGSRYKVMLQDAETIRLVDADGEPVSIKDLEKGDRILAYLSGQARHFGMAIEEKLIER
jgi:3-dehydroquinate synthase II